MKRIKVMMLLLVGVALLAVGCKEKPHGQLKQGAMVYININKNTRAMDIEARTLPVIDGDEQKIMTPLEIVEDAGYFKMDTEDNIINGVLGIMDVQKDFENARIKMWGEQIINEDGTLNSYFMNARNIRICGKNRGADRDPIIAYIPNKVMEEAWEEIKIAYDAGDYTKVYAIFERAYTAIPCTTKQWEALREKGEQ